MKSGSFQKFGVSLSVCFSIVLAITAQEDKFTFCQRVADWSNFYIDSTVTRRSDQILVVSSRPYLPDQEAFLPNALAEWRKITYFLAYCENNTWYLSYVPDLETGMNALNDGHDFLFFVHGHGKTFPSALSRAAQIQTRYNVKTILFDWPSFNSNFNRSLARVRRTGENFYNTLLQIKDYRSRYFIQDQKLSIFAHSLGNYFLTHLVVNGNNQFIKTNFIDNLIINAAAVKSEDHGEVISQLNFQKQIYVVLNENDRVLKGAHLIMYGKMLGNYAISPLAVNAEYLHFTPVANKQHTYFAGYHAFEYDNPAVFKVLNTIIHGNSLDLSNDSLLIKRSEGDGYDIKSN